MKDIIIAIDGYSSCGKSTVAKELARILSYRFIDSGAMYRAVTLHWLKSGLPISDNPDIIKMILGQILITFHVLPINQQSEIHLNGENVEWEIRTLEVSQAVSLVSSFSPVRELLVRKQKGYGEHKKIVMDGRDIGTVVFPNAELKIFMTANPQVRALRRQKELTEKGFSVSLDEIVKNLEERDHLDTHRKDSPLKKAGDAIELDNSFLTREEQLDFILKHARERMKD